MEPLPGAGPLPAPPPVGGVLRPSLPWGRQVPLDELVALVAQFVARTEAEVVELLTAARPPAASPGAGDPAAGAPPELVRAVREALVALAARRGASLDPEALDRAVEAVLTALRAGGRTVVLPPGPRPAPPDGAVPGAGRPGTPVPPLPGATPPGATPLLPPRDGRPVVGMPPGGPTGPGAGGQPVLAPALSDVLGELGRSPDELVQHLAQGGTLAQLARSAGVAPERLAALLRPAVAAGGARAGWDDAVVDQVVAAAVAAHGPQPLPVQGGSLLAAAEEVLRMQRPARRDEEGEEPRRPRRDPDHGEDPDEDPDGDGGHDVPASLQDFVEGEPGGDAEAPEA